MTVERPGDLVPLFPEEEANYELKEKWQRRAIGWFGLATGLALSVKFARVYYEFLAARFVVPGHADSLHYDLEYTALLGIILGIVLAVAPVIIAFRQSRKRPEAFAAKKFKDSGFKRWLLGITTILISIAIILLGIGSVFVTSKFGWVIGFENGEWIVMFGALLLATPLLIEGIWTLYAYRRGIEKVLVLRNGKWSHE